VSAKGDVGARPGKRHSFELPVLDQPQRVAHARSAARFVADEARADWHDGALWWVRAKRDLAAASLPEWEELRDLASRIKEHTLSRLADYLEQFEANATANGIQVHWARDAAEHNAIVHGILTDAGASRLVKSKSMLTEECGLNPYLEDRGIEVTDTDLGERIVQLRGEAPSHIVLPAIHLRKEDVGDTFHRHLGTAEGLADPTELAGAARTHLRQRFLAADAALTGANFALAETGGFVVCTNEGNADLGMALAPVHIASIGIEKLIPRAADLGVFLRLLARSATGQPTTVYTSHVHGGEQERAVHVVLVDNGRSTQLGREGFWRSLKCIRCGACMNTCPVYRRSGGHSYGSTIPGPIGSVLTPGLDLERYATLPFASTLCGSCTAVCPVKIDLDAQLYRWRQVVARRGYVSQVKRFGIRLAGAVLSRPRLFRVVGLTVRAGLRAGPKRAVRALSGSWGRTRDLPSSSSESFHAWYRRNRGALAPARTVSGATSMAIAHADAVPHVVKPNFDRSVVSRDAATSASATDARREILQSVRAAHPAVTSLPGLPVSAASCELRGGLVERYAEAARHAGADVTFASSRDAADIVATISCPAARVASTISEITGTVGVPDDPHEYATLDVFVARGAIGVAENGCVWLSGLQLAQRAGLFLATHTVLLLDRSAIVPNLHVAYQRLDVAAEPFGVFVAGPSKTADIEQALVIGAHGPRALTVILVDSAS
jgi:L-lactate dehydrogenase complex protein LldF